MKLESLLNQLEQVRVQFEEKDMEELGEDYRAKVIILLLLDYLGNKKIEEKVNEICF